MRLLRNGERPAVYNHNSEISKTLINMYFYILCRRDDSIDSDIGMLHLAYNAPNCLVNIAAMIQKVMVGILNIYI